jgi:hypothetical protein
MREKFRRKPYKSHGFKRAKERWCTIPDREAPLRASDDYELVPRNQIDYLRREVELLKRNPFGDSKSSKDVLTALDALNQNISKLTVILETANDEIVRDYKDDTNTKRIAHVLEQNEKLARGIVVIADLLKELQRGRSVDFKEESFPLPKPVPQPVPQRPGPQPSEEVSADPWNKPAEMPKQPDYVEWSAPPAAPKTQRPSGGFQPPSPPSLAGEEENPFTGEPKKGSGLPFDFSEIPPPP